VLEAPEEGRDALRTPEKCARCNKSITGFTDNEPSKNAEVSGPMKGVGKFILIGALLIPAIALAASWWSNDWKYRKEIGFDLSPTGAAIATTVQDVPVLVRLSLANFSYFNDTKADGADFRLISGDDKTPLKFHFERYDPQSQLAFLWVLEPQITGGSKSEKIYAYYGNADAPSAADVAGTYDAQQVLVLSFPETSGLPMDGTAYKNNPSASTATLTPASLIAGGAQFTGKDSITVPATASLRLLPNQGLTASAWVKVAQPQDAAVLALTDGAKSIELDISGAKVVARAVLGGAPVTVTSSADIAMSQWHHMAFTAGSGKLTLYVDGVAVGSAPVTLAEVGGNFTVGALGGAKFLTGDVDEVQVSKVARTPEWIKAAAASQGMDPTMVLFGADGQREGGGQTSYFATIAKNLTADGWVVIGICMAMLVIALGIMIVKAFSLTRVERANAKFLKEFRRLGAKDATALDEPAAEDADDDLDDAPSMASLANDQHQFGASTLYRLYHHGVREVNKRIAAQSAQSVGAARAYVMSPQSIDAIRAAMDGTMTRMQQTLSSQMVLLTIAISGGPFLGLLGTVIGVMITFAAIALSGDVNVNAIAPGVAAALAATVAGLAVAIPALFGYNWLNTRIKSINADNRVFVDEFVTLLAEQYS
jgi:biopolymer transport protein ExbB